MSGVKQTAVGMNAEQVKAEQARVAAELKAVEEKIAAVLAGEPEPASTSVPVEVVNEPDPSGVGSPLIVPPVAIVPPVEPSAPAVLPDQRYEYQPCDENGRPMGGRQVIIYKTPDELTQKLVAQNESILRQLRKVTREKVLGVSDGVVDDSEKFQNVVEFKPRNLTADERFAVAQKLTSPETADEARDLLIESAFGAKPEILAQTLNDQQKFIIQQRAVDNYIQFVNSSPDYYDSAANRDTVTLWMAKNNNMPTHANFVKAFQRLTQAGLLEVAPVVQQASVTPPAPVEEPPVVTVEPESKPQTPAAAAPGLGTATQPQVTRHSHVPSGLNPSVASAAGPNSPVEGGVTLADIDKLPSDVYRAKLKDPKFAALVNRLENEAAVKRAEKGIRR